MRTLHNILVTGGSGFIGSSFIRYLFGLSSSGTDLFSDADFSGNVINVDKLTYAGNPENLSEVQEKFGGKRYFFEKADISDGKSIGKILEKYNIDTIVNFAAETHVDRSIKTPDAFIKTNVNGTFTLLEEARKFWNCTLENRREDVLFHQISTDEVYGSLSKDGFFTENSPYAPRSPYSASKASADHLVMSYFHTFGLPVTISSCSNNYGPYQFPEKFIPLMILNMKEGKNLPVYGNGKNVRDWIYVEDHNRAVLSILRASPAGERWNIGSGNELENNELLSKLTDCASFLLKKEPSEIRKTISYIKDRPGHDLRYAMDTEKIRSRLNWKPLMDFNQGLSSVVSWYLQNESWVNNVKNGSYRDWIRKNYDERLD